MIGGTATRICAGAVTLGLGALGIAAPAQALAGAPNIVLIVADDLGYDQTSLYGRAGSIPTPNIAALADDGVRLTSGYVGSPVCSPSRSALLTGVEPAAAGADSNFLTRERPERMPTATMASALPAAYSSIAIGKWDLAGASPFDAAHLPHALGFDDFYGFFGGQHDYCAGGANLTEYNPSTAHYDSSTNTSYLTDEITDRAVDYVDDHAAASATNPFFMYLAYNAPHVPLQTPTTCAGGTQTEQARFSQMVGIMDTGIGAVRQALDDHGIGDNTIVIFLSDNGQQTSYFTGSTRGGKYTLFEGGIKVPMAITWPDGLPAASTYGKSVSSLDLYPTVLSASGSTVTPPASSLGVDLRPYLNGSGGSPHPNLSWRYVDDKAEAGHQGVVTVAQRLGNLKWVRVTAPPVPPSATAVTTNYLFDLSSNPTESDAQNLWPNASLAAPLLAAHNSWNAQNALVESFKSPRSATDVRADLPDGYIESSGTWTTVSVAGDKSYQGTSSGLAGRSVFELGYYGDAKTTSTLRLVNAGQAAVIIRGSGAAASFDGYVAGIAIPQNGSACAGASPQPGGGSPRVFLTKVVGGVGTVVACQDLALTTGTDYTVVVRAVGGALTVSFNGTQRLAWTDSSGSKFLGGQIGLRVVGVSASQNSTAQFATLNAQKCSGTCS